MCCDRQPGDPWGVGLASSTILLAIFLGDRPEDFVDVLPGFKLKWSQTHANEKMVWTGFYLFGPHFDLYQSLNRLPI